MKIYHIETMETPNTWGDVKFEWTDTDEKSTKVCIQHVGQPAVFFEELLRDNGYRKAEEKQVSPWDDNSIQFPRLICEINACVDIRGKDWQTLCESMDLQEEDVEELFDRANDEWEKIKQNI